MTIALLAFIVIAGLVLLVPGKADARTPYDFPADLKGAKGLAYGLSIGVVLWLVGIWAAMEWMLP